MKEHPVQLRHEDWGRTHLGLAKFVQVASNSSTQPNWSVTESEHYIVGDWVVHSIKGCIHSTTMSIAWACTYTHAHNTICHKGWQWSSAPFTLYHSHGPEHASDGLWCIVQLVIMHKSKRLSKNCVEYQLLYVIVCTEWNINMNIVLHTEISHYYNELHNDNSNCIVFTMKVYIHSWIWIQATIITIII